VGGSGGLNGFFFLNQTYEAELGTHLGNNDQKKSSTRIV
jgi:hypothetical protein